MKSASIALALALALSSAHAAEINGLRFPEQLKVGPKSLALNGLGLRQATFLRVNVYAAGLYLETASQHDGEQVARSPGLKRIEMTFMRDVGGGKIAGAWAEGFENNCTENCEAMKPGIARLQALTTDMKKGDTMAFDFYPDHVEMFVRGAKLGSIDGKEFSRNLLRLWIGKKPPNAGLKTGLLSLKE